MGGESQAPGAHPQAAPGLQGNEEINKLTGLGSEKGENPPRRAQNALPRGPVSKTFLINSVFHRSVAAEFPCLKQIPVDYQEHIYPALSTSGHRRGLLLCTLVPEHSVICFTPSADAGGGRASPQPLQIFRRLEITRGKRGKKVSFLPAPLHLCCREKPPRPRVLVGAVINEGPRRFPR